MMMRKVYTTPDHFTMLLLKIFNLLLIFLSRPYVARNRCRFGWLAGGGFLVCGLFWVVSLGASGPLGRVDHWRGTFPSFWPGSGIFLGASGPLDEVDHWLGAFPSFCPGFGGCLESFLAMATTYLRESAGYYGGLLERICRLTYLTTLFIYYIDK